MTIDELKNNIEKLLLDDEDLDVELLVNSLADLAQEYAIEYAKAAETRRLDG